MIAGSQSGDNETMGGGHPSRSAGSLARIRAALGRKDLQDDERAVLEALMKAGYDEKGRPQGRKGALTAGRLSEVLHPLMLESVPERRLIEHAETCKRRLRKVINRLIIHFGIPIMCEAGYGGGYYLPAHDGEVEANHGRFHKRSMTGLVKASRARKAAYADAIVQLTLGYEKEADAVRERLGIPVQDDEGPPPWVAVVTGLLDRVKGDPEKYAAEIGRIRDEYGDIFVRRDKVKEIRRLSSELNRVLEGLAS